MFRSYSISFQIYIVVMILDNNSEGKVVQTLSHDVGWTQDYNLQSLDFEERGMFVWTFIGTWEKDMFRRVAIDVSDWFSHDATPELSVLGSVVAAVRGSASIVAFPGGSHVLVEIYGNYLGFAYDCKLNDYSSFDLWLLSRCRLKRCVLLFSGPASRFSWPNLSSPG